MIIKTEHNFQKKFFYHCDAQDLNVQKNCLINGN